LPPAGVDLADVERQLIEQALARTDGNTTAAARLLHITRHTLDYRLGKHGLA
jgi:DNA-binding NtrC family response regulator